MSPDISQERFLSIPAVLGRTNWSRATLYRNVKRGNFPRQIKTSDNRVGFPESAVNAWFVSKMEAAA